MSFELIFKNLFWCNWLCLSILMKLVYDEKEKKVGCGNGTSSVSTYYFLLLSLKLSSKEHVKEKHSYSSFIFLVFVTIESVHWICSNHTKKEYWSCESLFFHLKWGQIQPDTFSISFFPSIFDLWSSFKESSKAWHNYCTINSKIYICLV